MIVDVKGRASSVQTLEELEELIRSDLTQLSPSDQAVLFELLEALSDEESASDVLRAIRSADYKREVVDIETFVRHPYFLGETCKDLYPVLLNDLREIFEGDYNEIIYTGSIGFGKCVDGDTEVFDVATGYRMRVRDLSTLRVQSFSSEGHSRVSRAEAFSSGEKQCVTVTLASGDRVTLSTDHPVLTGRGWVQAEQVLQSDVVATPRCVPDPDVLISASDEEVVPPFEARLPACFYGLPRRQVGLLLGRLWRRDGSFSQLSPGACLVVSSVEMARDVQFLLRRLGVRSRYTLDAEASAWCVHIVGRGEMVRFLDAVGDIEGMVGECRAMWRRCLTPDFVVGASTDAEYILWEQVLSVENAGVRAVFDLSVPGDHNFVANGIVVHNTFACSIGVCYVLYQLSCMHSPAVTFNLAPETPITVIGLSASEDLAKEVVLKNVIAKIGSSKYFREHFRPRITQRNIRFPNGVTVWARATTPRSALGMNPVCALVDEIDFMPRRRQRAQRRFGVVNMSKEIYDSITRRIKSRFGRYGKLFLPCSKSTSDSFLARRLKEAEGDPNVFVRDYCLSGDTSIPLLDGTTATLRELVDRYGGTDERVWVYSLNTETGRVVPGSAHHPRMTARSERVLDVELDNGEVVRATPWHPFLLRSAEYRRADELRSGDSLMSLYRRENRHGYEEVTHPSDDVHFSPGNHKVVAVRDGGREDVYDLSVEGYENFAICQGVFVHNSLWEAKPGDYSTKTFWVICGNEQVPSRILVDTEVDSIRDNQPERTTLLEVPEDFRGEFESDLEGCLAAGTRIPLLSGETVSIEDLVGRDEFWVHSCTPEGRRQSGRGSDARMTHEHAPLLRVEVDSGGVVRCTPHHPFMLRDGSYRAAESLKCGDRLMSCRFGDSPDGHVVSVTPNGYGPVYDIAVDTWSNFALDSGIVVHNSIRDLGGVATVTFSPFIQRRHKVYDMEDETRSHPFSTERYEAGKAGHFLWDEITTEIVSLDEDGRVVHSRQPILHPDMPRHVHFDPALNQCSAGMCVVHQFGTTQVKRRNKEMTLYGEEAPIFFVDLILEIVPPIGGELEFAMYRQLVYDFVAHGFPIVSVSMDGYHTIDGLQLLANRGYHTAKISLDKSWDPYQHAKSALYEDRVKCYHYAELFRQLQKLEADWEKRKVLAPEGDLKDVADAFAGALWGAYHMPAHFPYPFLVGESSFKVPLGKPMESEGQRKTIPVQPGVTIEAQIANNNLADDTSTDSPAMHFFRRRGLW